jgi:uncharacterized membrane-anchored protein YitT (DUF2179 family)
MAEPHTALSHSVFDDAQAFVLGTALCALGLQFLTHLGLVTGQTAGLAVLVSYLTGWPFGAVFFAINLPFYALALGRMGLRFTVRTAIAVALVSALAELFPLLITFDRLDPLLGAAISGALIGLGLILLFRHGASLGGIGILALWLQDRTGFKAGYTQLAFDAALFAMAAFVLDLRLVALSLVGAVVTNLIIATNHRKDRYVGR